MHMQPVFKDCDYIQIGNKSISQDLFERGVCLPSDTKMTLEDMNRIIEVIKGLF